MVRGRGGQKKNKKMSTSSSDKNNKYENYHRWKIDRADVLTKKISRILKQDQLVSIVVPTGLQQVFSPWFVPRPLHCSTTLTNSTHEVHPALDFTFFILTDQNNLQIFMSSFIFKIRQELHFSDR